MGIGQADLADVGLTNVADDHLAFDRITLHQLGDFRLAARGRILEQAQTTTLIEADAPTVAMRTGTTTALHQPSETEHDVGGYIGTHAQKFTHAQASMR
jgi:hypothetical protein